MTTDERRDQARRSLEDDDRSACRIFRSAEGIVEPMTNAEIEAALAQLTAVIEKEEAPDA